MLKLIPKPCRKTGCKDKTADKSGYCDKHRNTESGWHLNEKRRGNRHKRGYGTAWNRLRQEVLERDKGLCQEHLSQGRTVAGNHVDHIIPKEQGGTDELTNLQVLCADCHRTKTAKERRRGGGLNLYSLFQ